jgi:ATPase subunit of ABC transporter with duplicated ATPase domains
MNLSFLIQRGTKLGVIGPNGVGKSTLLKILLDQVEAATGNFKWSESVKIGYFAQDFHHLLDPAQTLLQWLADAVPSATEGAARKALGQMLFSGADANKKIKVLSGGECARLVFAKLFLEKCNVLVLDEPTNHLDLEAIEGLAEGLHKFVGTVVFVSHNRFLIKNVANHILAMEKETFEIYPGTYDEYSNRKLA